MPKINRNSTLELFKMNQKRVNSRAFNSDGDVDDMGAIDYCAEMDAVIEAIERGDSDEQIISIADDLCFLKWIRFDNDSDISERPFYVTVYKITRHYGGPEEGGWYYNFWEQICSIPICYNADGSSDECELIEFMEKKFNYLNSGNIYSAIPGSKMMIYSERERGEKQTTEIPIYE